MSHLRDKERNIMKKNIQKSDITEFHLFAGIGGGIYGGELLGHRCVGGVEIDKYCQTVLRQRQKDGWMNTFDIYDDVTKLNGEDFKGKFDILCGGFPCQFFSYASHGKGIEEKNLWPYMLDFVLQSEAPMVFGENVTVVALSKAKSDLEKIGYKVAMCRLACMDLNADHKRPRFWLLAVKDDSVFEKVSRQTLKLPKFQAFFWTENPHEIEYPVEVPVLAPQKRGVGNAQAPVAAATAFRVLVNRLLNVSKHTSVSPSEEEISAVFIKKETWIQLQNPGDPIYIHTPTTMGNYHYKSMMKHPSCAKYVRVFGKPTALHAEYLMGFPIGASSPYPMNNNNFKEWKEKI